MNELLAAVVASDDYDWSWPMVCALPMLLVGMLFLILHVAKGDVKDTWDNRDDDI